MKASYFQVFFIALTIGQLWGACLDKAALEGLGMTGVKSEPEIIEDAEVCKGLFKAHGACVDVA